MNKDVLCTDVVGLVGEPFEIETTSQFDKATLTYVVDKSKLGDTEFDNLLFCGMMKKMTILLSWIPFLTRRIQL